MKNSPVKKTQVASVSDLFQKPHEENEEQLGIAYLSDYEEQALEYINNQGEYKGVHTGFPEIDSVIGSFLPGEIFTIGGDTGHGKSLLAMNIAQNVYKLYNQAVLFINLELTVEQAVQRFYNLSEEGENHDYSGIMVQKSVDLNYKDIDRLMHLAKEENVKLVVVDHLHFFDESIGDNAHAAITRIMKFFKRCAVKYELPVLLLSHVTPHTTPTGETLKPGLHNFKGSKSIEQVSDMVGFVYRHDDDPKRVDFYVRKNRSRELITHNVELEQKDWKLKEIPEWLQGIESRPLGELPPQLQI